MSIKQGKLLSKISSPEVLRDLSLSELPEVCQELRDYIIEVISANPGHLGASLGAVELAVAIHYVFNTPYDKLVWDVGHQAYAHKILTGRKDNFNTNRLYKGISGFPRISESEYDAFGVGHSSTSISAALGMAIASKLKNEKDRHHIAVIGDGSMTGGMAVEALNNAGVSDTNLLVILNDNGISIDKSVGAFKEYLIDIATSRTYNKFKNFTWHALGKVSNYGPNSQLIAQQIENAVKTTIFKKSNLFEAFNFRYFGPVDGNDVVHLTKLLNDMKNIPGPKLLHCVTIKGKGFKRAEKDQTRFHSPGVFNKTTGDIIHSKNKEPIPPKYQDVFGDTIIELAEKNEKILGITPAMLTGCSLNKMKKIMPDRVFDVGIAEQHAVTFAAGLASQGFIPYCNIYSTFMQRGYDQLIHDVALQKLNVVFCLDRSGLVGEDGATHHGAFDLAYLHAIPNMIVSAPMNEQELRNLMYTAQVQKNGPFSIRYPRGRGVMINWKTKFEKIEIGKGRIIKDGDDIAVISIGHPGNFVVDACEKLKNENISIAHFDLRFLKPLDENMLNNIFKKFDKIICVEDGVIAGGMGSAVLEFMADNNYNSKVKRLGIPDRFIQHGTPKQLFEECGYNSDSIADEIKKMMS